MARRPGSPSPASPSGPAGDGSSGSRGGAPGSGGGTSASGGAPGSGGTGAGSDDWPGKGLGLPESGPRSVGRLGRRLIAIVIDYALASLIALVTGLYGVGHNIVTLGFFAALQVVFIPLLSGSFGHICVGLRVVPVRGGYVGVWRPVVRTVLLCLAIPAFISDKEGRGLHDRAAGTVLVRR